MRLTRYALLITALYLTYLVLDPFLGALTWAVVFAILFHGMWAALARRLRPAGAAIVTTIVVVAAIVAPGALLLSALAREGPQIAAYAQQSSREVPHQIQKVWKDVRARSPFPMAEDPSEFVTNGTRRAVAMLASSTGALVADSFATLGSFAAMLFALFFMLLDGEAMSGRIRDWLPFSSDDNERLLHETRDMVVASVGAGVVVAAIQGAIGGLAFWFAGLTAPVFWGVVIAFASFLPVIGAAIVWAPVGVWLLMSHAVGRGVFVLSVGTFAITLGGNLLRSRLLSKRTSASPLLVFLGVLGGASAFGLVGLVVGPIILVTCENLLESVRRAERPGNPEREARVVVGANS